MEVTASYFVKGSSEAMTSSNQLLYIKFVQDNDTGNQAPVGSRLLDVTAMTAEMLVIDVSPAFSDPGHRACTLDYTQQQCVLILSK